MTLVETLRKKQLMLLHIKHNYKEFLEKRAWTLANQLILDEIQNKMRQEKFSKKIIDKTYIKSVKFIDNTTLRINIISDFVSESGFKVSLARELGTDNNKPNHKHFIKPKTKLALSWIAQGIRLFSKGHYVTGLKSLHIIQNTINEQTPTLTKMLQKDLTDWKNSLAKNV